MLDRLRSTRFRLQYLFRHPGFSRAPLHVLLRTLVWEFVRFSRRNVTVRIHGDCRMLLTPPKSRHGHAGLVYVFREHYEPSVCSAIDRYVHERDTVFDIGANMGLWSLRMSRLVGPDGRVVSFEPLPATASQLRTNAELSHASNIEIRQLALSDSPGRTTMYLPSDAGRASLAPEDARDIAIPVTQTTLDSIWIDGGRVEVPFVKIDIEGAEPLMLDGAQEFFRTCQPVTTCELNSTKLERLGFCSADILSRFHEIGYAPHRWDDRQGRFLPNADPSDGDVLFIPNRLL